MTANTGWGGDNLRNAARFEDLQRKVTDLRAGRLFPTGDVELVSDGVATTTTVEAQGCSKRSVVILVPKTAGAAAEIGAGTMFPDPDTKFFTIHHSASSAARRFNWVIFAPADKPPK